MSNSSMSVDEFDNDAAGGRAASTLMEHVIGEVVERIEAGRLP